MRQMPPSDAMDTLRTLASALAHFDRDASDQSPAANYRKAVRLTAQMGSLVAAIGRLEQNSQPIDPDPVLGFAANFLYLLTGRRPDALSVRAFDCALVLHADHELNASTFAARVAAATLTDIHSAIVGGIGALKGPLHGGANAEVMKMLLEFGVDGHAEIASRRSIREKLARKEKIPGFGHRVYHTMDPRAVHLRQLSKDLGKRSRRAAVGRDVRAHRGAGEEREEAEPERRLLLGFDVLRARHPAVALHADLRGQPHVRLDGARPRAVREQPPDSAARGIHGPGGPAAVGATRTALTLSLMVVMVAVRTRGDTAHPAHPGRQLMPGIVRELAAGKLLIAGRDLPDGNFAETVILLADYGAGGAMGLILNRQSDIPVSRAFPKLKAAPPDARIFVGGPVGTTKVVGLLRARSPEKDVRHIVSDIFLVAEREPLEGLIGSGADARHFRVYFGYAGWAPGQLEHEAVEGAWHVVSADADLVFDPDPATIWQREVRRTEGLMARR